MRERAERPSEREKERELMAEQREQRARIEQRERERSPSKFVRSAVRSARLKVQGSCTPDWRVSFEDPSPSNPSCISSFPPTSAVNASIPIPDISAAVNGNCPVDPADAGLTAISPPPLLFPTAAAGATEVPLSPIISLHVKSIHHIQVVRFFQIRKVNENSLLIFFQIRMVNDYLH